MELLGDRKGELKGSAEAANKNRDRGEREESRRTRKEDLFK